MKKCCKKTHFC